MDTQQTDDEQVEQLKQWWRKNGFSTMLAVVLGIGSVAGYQLWTGYQHQKSSEAAANYQQVINLIKSEDNEKAESIGEILLREYKSTGYATLSALLLARSNEELQKVDDARRYLVWVEENSSINEYKQIARLRLARILSSKNDQDGALATLNKGEAGKFAGVYEDLKGDIFLKQGKVNDAKNAYILALAQVQVPGLKQLIKLKLDDLGAE